MKLNKNLNYKQKILLGLAINFSIIFFILYFFVFSYLDIVKEANLMLINHRVDFETKIIKEVKFSKISKNLSKIEDEIKIIDKSFIDQNKKLEFITMFEGLADDNKIKMIMDISFDKINTKNYSVPLNLTLSGSQQNLLDLLVSIENLDYYININTIKISSINNATAKSSMLDKISSGSNLTMNIGAMTFWK